MKSKQIITALVVGLIGGLAGALIFEPIDGISDILFSDYTIGGVIIGAVLGFIKLNGYSLGKFIFFSIIVGAIVFLIFGLISGKIVDDLIAGIIIGLLVALASHLLSPRVKNAVEAIDDKIDDFKEKKQNEL